MTFNKHGNGNTKSVFQVRVFRFPISKQIIDYKCPTCDIENTVGSTTHFK